MTPRDQKQRRKNRRSTANRPPESRAAEAVTVAWTVTVMTLSVCHLCGLFVWIYLRYDPQSKQMAALAGLLLLTSLLLAVANLVMIPIVHKMRRTAPPRPFVVFAVIVAAVPFGVLLAA